MDILDFAKNVCKIELLPWQEEILKQYEHLSHNNKIMLSRYSGRQVYLENLKLLNELLMGEKLIEIRASDIDPNKQDGRMSKYGLIETI